MELKDFKLIMDYSPDTRRVLVEVLIKIKKNETGEIKEFLEFYTFDTLKNSMEFFPWAEGAFSCDCNRAIKFGDNDESCGESRFSVNIENPKTGEILYKEYEE